MRAHCPSAACGRDFSGDAQTKSKQRFTLHLSPKHLLELEEMMTMVKLGVFESFAKEELPKLRAHDKPDMAFCQTISTCAGSEE